MTQNSFHTSTPRTGRDLSLSNYHRKQQEMQSMRRSHSGVFRTRVLQNNIRGKPIDKITEEQMRPDATENVSTYQQDYYRREAERNRLNLKTSQGFRDKVSTPPQQESPVTPTRPAYGSAAEYAYSTARDTAPQIIVDNNFTPQSTYRTVHSTTNRDTDSKTSPKKKMLYSTQWEPFYNLPKKPNTLTLNYRGAGKSLYQRDYLEHPADEKGIVMTNDFYTTKQKRESVDYRTTARTDYKDWHQAPPKREGAKRGLDYETPFGGNSNYRNEYVDWGASGPTYERTTQPLNIIPDVPFKGRTTYKDNYIRPAKEEEDAKNYMTKTNREGVFTQTIPFLGQTSYQKTFRPFKVGGAAQSTKKAAEYNGRGTYPGQFRTTFGTDFTHPKERIYWPGHNDDDDEYLTQYETYSSAKKYP